MHLRIGFNILSREEMAFAKLGGNDKCFDPTMHGLQHTQYILLLKQQTALKVPEPTINREALVAVVESG